MSANLKSYFKSALKQFLISLVFPLLVFFIVKDKDLIAVWIFFNFLGLIPGYYKYNARALYEQKLKARGLTFEDLNNIEFARNWYEIRNRGVIKYSVIDGGVFFGFFLSVFIGIVSFFFNGTWDYIRTGPSNMFNFIGYTYLAGAMSGVIIYRILWLYNEEKFIRLTDPLH